MQAKLQETEQNLEGANVKCNNLEKVKSRLQGEIEDMSIEVDRVSYCCNRIIFNIDCDVEKKVYWCYQCFIPAILKIY